MSTDRLNAENARHLFISNISKTISTIETQAQTYAMKRNNGVPQGGTPRDGDQLRPLRAMVSFTKRFLTAFTVTTVGTICYKSYQERKQRDIAVAQENRNVQVHEERVGEVLDGEYLDEREEISSPEYSSESALDRLECDICYQSCGRDEWVCCSGGLEGEVHFMCSECLETYVASKLEHPERITGEICCPMFPLCNAQLKRFVKHIPERLYKQYFDAFKQGVRDELGQRNDLEVNRRVQAKLDELEAAHLVPNSVDEKVHRAVTFVVDEILTVRCPRCTQAILDFEGCYSLKCARCDAAICAWCLADCGHDAHSHVADCPKNRYRTRRDPFFAKFEYFELARQAERIEKLKQFLNWQVEPALLMVDQERLAPILKPLKIGLYLKHAATSRRTLSMGVRTL
eukprot:1053364-Prorocentrum_minimum.AAC.1